MTRPQHFEGHRIPTRASARDSELGELRDDSLALGGRTHLLIHVEDPAVDADVESPPRRKRPVLVHDAVSRRDRSSRVAQKRIVDTKRLRERPVGFWRVYADCKIRDVEGLDFVAALTERLAGGRSSSGKGLCEPGENHGLLAFKVGQAIGPAVRTRQIEWRCRIARLDVCRRKEAH
jgi:hypothetical protein